MIDYSEFEPEDSEAPAVDIPASSVQQLTERYRAGALNPDLYAKSKVLSSSTGLPETVVARNMPEAERRAAEPDWLVFESKAPDTAKRLAEDVDFFNLAHDDTENLSFWEKTLRTGREIASDAKKGFEAGQVTNELGLVGANAMFAKMAPETRARAQQLNARIESLKGSGGFVEATAKILGQMSESFPAAIQAGSVFGTAAGTAALVAGQAGPQAALPEEIITAPVSAAGGFAAGFGASMAENSYRVEAGHMYLDMIEAGVDEGIASVSAAGGGIVNAALETAGFAAVSAPAKQAFTKLATEALTTQLSKTTTSEAVKNFARNYALAYGGEVGTEILQEVVAVTAEEIAKAVDPKDLDSMLTTEEGRAQISARLEGTAAEVMKGMALLALPGASANFVADMRAASKAKQNAQLFQAIGDNAKASKVLPRDANAFEKHLAQLAKDGPTDTVYVSAKDFFNAVAATGKDPNQVAQEIPSVREQWQEAQNLDADLVIPFSEYVARVAPSDAHDALVQHLKFAPDQISAAQAIEAERGKIREQMNIAAEIYRTNQEWKDSADQVFDAVNEQLAKAGRYSPAVNRANAALVRDFYTVMASRIGMKPAELWQRQPITVDGTMPGGGAFEQPAYHGSPSVFDRFNINRAGANGAMYGWGLYFSSSEDVARFYKDAFGGGGRVYKVDISEDDSFLQWDLPLNDQPENVKKRLKDVSEFLLGLNINEETRAKISDGTITAGDYYTILSGEMSLYHNTETMIEGKRLASEALWLEGVHGIKHRDTNSYKFEGAPFNYVVFDDSAVRIQNTFYQTAALPDTIEIDGVQRSTTNSNGKPIAQTEEGVRNFWRWFGDSQVVDEQGRPLVVYHGTGRQYGNRGELISGDFDTFDPGLSGKASKTGAPDGTFFFTNDPEVASSYTVSWRGDFSEKYRDNANVMPVYLRISKPEKVNAKGENWRDVLYKKEFRDVNEIAGIVKDSGKKDGLIVVKVKDHGVGKTSGKPANSYVVFNPEQIKSAVGNSGAFDASNPNILYQSQAVGDFVNVDGVQRPTANSNGKPIAQTEDGVRNFWRWFGDSKVVDEQGRPLVVYHGTAADIEAFDLSRAGEVGQRFAEAAFFTDNPTVAAGYSQRLDAEHDRLVSVEDDLRSQYGKAVVAQFTATNTTDGELTAEVKRQYDAAVAARQERRKAIFTNELPTEGANLVPAYLRIVDPEEVDAAGGYFFGTHKQAFSAAQDANADGVVVRNVVDRANEFADGVGDVFAVFDPAQIKSAIGNSGAFDPQNPNILQQKALGTFNPETFNISLLETANLSTFLHETGHAFFEMMGHLARDADAASPIRADMDILLKWIGVEGATAEDRLSAWLAMPLNDRRAGHEKFAESFEQYLFEGKAPNTELQSLFTRFSQWLKLVYKSLSDFMQQNTGAQLTDDVRGVMDRMLATDDQIEAARQRASATPMQGIETALTQAEYQAYITDNGDAVAIAQGELERRSLRDMQWLRNATSKVLKALQNKAKETRKAVRAVVEQEMLREPIYAADRFIRHGTHQPEKLTNAQRKAIESIAGGSTKMSLDALKAMYGDGPAAQWRYLAKGKYGLAATDGIHPDILATALGFKSGDALVRALLSATPFSEELDARTDRRMLEEHGELVDDAAMKKAADAAVHNQARTRILATELSALQRLAKTAGFSIAAAREYAARIVDNAKIKELKASKYSAAEAKAAKDAQQLLKKGDRVGAAAAKFRQVLNHFAVIKAADAQNEIDAARRQFAKMFKKRADLAKGRDADIAAAAQAVLARYGLAPANKDPSEYLANVATYAPEFAADLASIISGAPDPKPWDQMTVAEFLTMRDVVTSLWTMAKRAKEIEVDGRRVGLDQAVTDLYNQAGIGDTDNRIGLKSDVGEIDKFKMLAFGARAAMRRVESWVDMMDDGKADGPFRRYIFTPIREAVDRYRIAKRDVMQRYADLIKTIEAGLTFAPIDAPELGYTFSGGKASIIGAMLHTGNESNMQKLLRGREWGDFRDDGSLDTSKWDAFMRRMIDEQVITKADWDFVQGVWDLLEELKPQAQAAHHDMYGYYFDEVQAGEVVTPFGRYRGGYFPAMADPASSASALQFEDADAVLHGQNSFMLPTTGRGFTKSRTGGARPLVMDLRATTQHIDKLLRFVHVEPRIKDTYRIVRHPAFKGMADRINPQLINSMLLPWMQRTAQQLTGQPGGDFLSRHFGKLLNKLRTRTGLNMMVLNIVNALQQVTGFSMAAVKVGPGHLNAALWRYMREPKMLSAFIDAKSNFMQTRTSSQAMEISNEIELILNPTKLQTAKAFAERHGYFLQQTLQNFIDRTVWLGAYDQATAQGLDDTTAVRQADAAVRQTQGSFNAEDISRVEAGSPLSRLFTMFYSYFNMQSNLLATEFSKAFKADGLVSGRALYVYAMGFMIPAVVAELIAGVARGEIDDEDDDGYMDEFLALFFNSQARTLSAMAPYVNVLTTAGLAKYDGKWYNDRISASPAVSTLDAAVSTATLPFDVMFTDKEINGMKAARDFFTTIGLITGIPAGVINRPIGWIDQATDGE